MPLVPEKHFLEHAQGGCDARGAARSQAVQRELRGNELGGVLGVRGRTRAAAHDIVGDVVDLLAILLEDDCAGRGAGVGA